MDLPGQRGRREAFTDPSYQHTGNQLLITGNLQWRWARRNGGSGRLTSWLLELTDTLDIEIPAAVEYDPDDRAAVAAAAGPEATSQMWVSPSSPVRQAPETPWAWATTIAARTEARSHLALIPVPILFRLAVGSSGFVPVCLDEDYTAQMVRTAQDLASSTDQVPELVKAVKAATT